MHVASLVFVGGGGCENLTEKLAVGVVGLTLGSACQRATNYSICKNLLLECTLGCPLHVQEGDRDVQSPTSRQLGSREVVVPGFVAEGVKANKGDNSTCTQKDGHHPPDFDQKHRSCSFSSAVEGWVPPWLGFCNSALCASAPALHIRAPPLAVCVVLIRLREPC